MADKVDNAQQHFPAAHCQCGAEVISSSTPYRRHQIFDIPTQAYSVDEHQLYGEHVNSVVISTRLSCRRL